MRPTEKEGGGLKGWKNGLISALRIRLWKAVDPPRALKRKIRAGVGGKAQDVEISPLHLILFVRRAGLRKI